MSRQIVVNTKMLLTAVLASVLISAPAQAQSTPGDKKPVSSSGKSPVTSVKRRYQQNRLPPSAQQYYSLVWGVDALTVKSVESGEIIRFTYRVIDPAKAKVLNEKKNEPSLEDPQARVKLVIPSLEKVGKLRQSTTPEAGKVYWMAFSNKGGHVKPGHHVNVAIGNFRADSLVVQ